MIAFSSPRFRRRAAWATACLLVSLGVAGAIVALPTGEPLPADTLSAAPAVERERQVELTPAVRRSIDATLDRFIPAAVERRDPAVAWNLAGPGLRGGTTRADWLAGNLPVFPFPVRDRRFEGWRPIYAYRDRVGLDLVLHAEPRTRRGPLGISVDVIRRGDRWLVDAWYPAAVFTGPDERPWVTGSPDFTPDGYTSNAYDRPQYARGRLDPAWFALPLAFVGAVVLAMVWLALSAVRRNRRAEAAHAAATRLRQARSGST